MSINTAAGVPAIKDKGLIPEFYALEVTAKYYAETLLPRITNTNNTEQIRNKGDKVTIPQEPTIVSKKYEIGMEMGSTIPSIPDAVEFTIDRAKYFNIPVDAVEKKQSQVALAETYKTAALKDMDVETNTEFFADIYDDAATGNSGATAGVNSASFNLGAAAAPLAVTTNNVLATIEAVRTVLGEQNAAQGKQDMWMVVPQWFRYLLMNSDLANASLTGDPKSILRTGRLVEIDGLTIYANNLLKTSADDQATGTYICAGNMDAISYCAQMTEFRTIEKPEGFFGCKVQGLYVYDWKVVKPEGLVNVYAYKG